MLFEFHAETLGYIISSSISARSEAWPVVEVDNSETAILGYDAVAAVDRSLEHRGSPVGSLFQISTTNGIPCASPLITSRPNLLR